MRRLPFLLLSLALSGSAFGQNWSVGVGSGPFVFGDFVERTIGIGHEGGPISTTTSTLSAGTRPGLVVDLERSLGERWAVRAEGTFTRAPLAIKSGDDDGFEFDAGELDIATLALPIVFRINRGGTFRFHVAAGPAHAAYRIRTDDGVDPLFEGTRSRWGLMTGLGVGWQWSERFAVEGNLSDVVTASPFRRSDFIESPGLEIKRPHNVHTSLGIRYRF